MYGDLVFKTVVTASVRVRESGEVQKPLAFCEGSEYVRYANMYRSLRQEMLYRTGWRGSNGQAKN
jgi:hypothetical protein